MTTPTPTQSPLKGLKYAEEQLGVNSVFEYAKTQRANLDAKLTDLAAGKDLRREVEHLIADREIELTSDEYAKHSGMSVAAMERHLKLELPKDPLLRELRAKLGVAVSDIEGLEFDIRMLETDIKIAVARMTELGGYLNYLAAIKQGQTKHTKETGEVE